MASCNYSKYKHSAMLPPFLSCPILKYLLDEKASKCTKKDHLPKKSSKKPWKYKNGWILPKDSIGAGN